MSRDTVDCPDWPADVAERYRAAGWWRGETFGQQLATWAERFGSRTALIDGEERLTYAELNATARRLSHALHELGLRRGDRVVVQLPNRAEFVVLWFALVRLGVVPVHAMPGHRRSEVGHLVAQSHAVAYFGPDRHARFDHRQLAAEVRAEFPHLAHVVIDGDTAGWDEFRSLRELLATEPATIDRPDPPAASDMALLLLSGGTTGTPKLIPRTHDDYACNARLAAEICKLGPHSVYLAVLPMPFNFTMSCPGILGVLQAGGTVVVARDPSPTTAFRLIERERVTITALNPPLVPLWLQERTESAADLSSLELLQVGAARLSDDLARRIRPELGCRLQQVFGMAEGLLNLTRAEDGEDLVCTTQGRPICPDDEVLVVDEAGAEVPPGEVGELLTRGPYTIRGYYRAEEVNRTGFTPDGYYRTGDQVRRLPSGHLSVVGRIKDQINRGGEKIDATEVEGHLAAYPGVLAAALVGAPDQDLGERPVAFLVCDGEPPTVRAVGSFLRERGLAAYKHPDRVGTVSEMPLTAVGKIDKKALVRLL
ncbi:(2,3-dihydroxybenzoyl)adenylate synthase [Micromonospora sp. HNM0581]|uniref:(2,3-dihydroxybenzoyl)adenylate synthase n=1 Tax=Micromonospora sp. HNM0581 TaxID=2716341 RepID=UPI00146E513E|nr:(2,3-dihydroxybenzoyl)adenylate synthase [Micromonospora sp. HNM0581]NLU79141.1 (2,3-dihydroxybenzoyl)adenylate synthase [Micromonospora sp. HNM0581]